MKGKPMTDEPALPTLPLATAQLLRRKQTTLAFAPDARARAAIASALDLVSLPTFRMTGEVTISGKHDLLLKGRISARVIQPCAVSLVPVETRIDEPVLRRYQAEFDEPGGAEVEMPEDDSIEPLTDSIDAAAVAIEALALALPMYPRAAGADLGETLFAPPGTAPLRDADLRPFAGLADLVGKSGRDKSDPEATG